MNRPGRQQQGSTDKTVEPQTVGQDGRVPVNRAKMADKQMSRVKLSRGKMVEPWPG